MPTVSCLLQMNALHEPWNDDALSEEISWGAAPALAQSPDALADTAASGGLPGLAGLGPGQEYQMAVTYRGAKVNGCRMFVTMVEALN
jgi:hypothetical protein